MRIRATPCAIAPMPPGAPLGGAVSDFQPESAGDSPTPPWSPDGNNGMSVERVAPGGGYA